MRSYLISESTKYWRRKKIKSNTSEQNLKDKVWFFEISTSKSNGIGSLSAEHKASYSLVFSDIEYRENIAGR